VQNKTANIRVNIPGRISKQMVDGFCDYRTVKVIKEIPHISSRFKQSKNRVDNCTVMTRI